MRRFALAAALAAACAAPAPADFPAAIEAYDQGDYESSFDEAKAVAERGDADAQYLLGYLYARGEGVRRDLLLAYLWYTLAARQGDEFAAAALAGLALSLSPEQIAAAEALARDWTPAAE
jgi:TPR repeat protein